MSNVVQCPMKSGSPFPTCAMSLLVNIILYWSTYLGCRVGPSFHLGVSYQQSPIAFPLDLSMQIALVSLPLLVFFVVNNFTTDSKLKA